MGLLLRRRCNLILKLGGLDLADTVLHVRPYGTRSTSSTCSVHNSIQIYRRVSEECTCAANT